MGYIGTKPTAAPLTSADIGDGQITAVKLGTDSVETTKVKDLNVTVAKLPAAVDVSTKTVTLPASVAGLGTGITNAQLAGSITDAKITGLSSSKLTGALPAISGASLTALPATLPASSGVNLTALNATNLGSGTVPTARLGSGSASSSVFLAGDNTWAATGGAVVGIYNIYNSSTNTYVSGQAGTNLTGNTYYPIASRIGGAFTKAEAGSKLWITGYQNCMSSNTNLHGSVLWRVGDEANFLNLGNDNRNYGWYDHGAIGLLSKSFSGYFTGVGAGSQTFYYASAVSGTRTHTVEMNANPTSNSIGNFADAPDKNTTSTMTVYEFN